jgi:large subunit ribosomal protein L18
MRNLTYKKRVQRIRKKLKKNNESRFRLSVYRSNRNISAQIIDDKNNKTLVSVSSLGHKTTGKNKKSDLSNYIAELISKKASEKKITNIYFDRGGYKYHGRIKIFAEVLRKNGLIF